MQNTLQHHGILGQKWGVRRYQNPDGTWTEAGKKRYGDNTSNFIKLTESSKEYAKDSEALFQERNKKLAKLNTKYATALTKKKKEIISDNKDKIDREWRDKDVARWKEWKDDEKQLRKKTFLEGDVKEDTLKAREIHKEIDSAYEKYLGTESKYAKEAYKQYVKDNKGEEDEYGFFHYCWGDYAENKTYSNYYKEAKKEYKEKTKELDSEYQKITTEIGKKVYGELANQICDEKYKMTYEEVGKQHLTQLILFEMK